MELLESTHIFWAITAILLFNFILSRALDFLNDSRKKPELPKEAEGIYNAEQYANWLAYDRAKGRLGIISSVMSLIGIVLLLFMGGFQWLNQQLLLVSSHPIVLALLFFGSLGLVSGILSLPLSWYSTFVVEERFGFNRTTPKTFWLDRIKGGIMSALLGGGLMALIMVIWLNTGDWFWWLAWACTTVVSVFMAMFYTSLIMPLFNKLTPLEYGPLRTAIEAYCQKENFGLKNLMVMDGSKRSSKANAFFSGLGPRKKIVLFDTLIEKHTIDEVVAVLAHEVGHYKKKHTLSSMVIGIAQMGLTFWVLSLVLTYPAFSEALGTEGTSFHIGLVVFGLLYSPLSTAMGYAVNSWSRRNEFQADAFAKSTADGEALETALTKMSVDQLSNLNPHPAYVAFYYSHPPLLQRLAALRQ